MLSTIYAFFSMSLVGLPGHKCPIIDCLESRRLVLLCLGTAVPPIM